MEQIIKIVTRPEDGYGKYGRHLGSWIKYGELQIFTTEEGRQVYGANYYPLKEK